MSGAISTYKLHTSLQGCVLLFINKFFCINKWNQHDIFGNGQATNDITPVKYEVGFLNRRWVQSALGVPLNFTYQNLVVHKNVMATGDIARGGFLEALGKLLDRGVQVTMMYGDRDYTCNWLGGERTSLAINSTISQGFREAGYAKIWTNSTNIGAMVRQFGNLSFSRVFDAGYRGLYPSFLRSILLTDNVQSLTTNPRPLFGFSTAPCTTLISPQA
jgi:Serine carboxypeptidase